MIFCSRFEGWYILKDVLGSCSVIECRNRSEEALARDIVLKRANSMARTRRGACFCHGLHLPLVRQTTFVVHGIGLWVIAFEST